MRKLLLFLLLPIAAFGQSWSGQSAGNVRVVPPYKFCVGQDNGQDNCIIQVGNQQARFSGQLDFAFFSKTVSNLPSAALNSGRVYQVVDGINSTDCSNGGGSTVVLCTSNGAAWITLAAGGGGVSGTAGQITVSGGVAALANPMNAPGPVTSPGPLQVNIGTAFGSVMATNDPGCILPATGFASICPLQTTWGTLLSVNSGAGALVAEPVCPNGFNAATLPTGIFSSYDATMNCFRLGAPLGAVTFASGLGAVSDIIGPSDQPLQIGTQNGKNVVFALSGGSISTTAAASFGPVTVGGAGAGTLQMTQGAPLSASPTNCPNCIGTSTVFFDAPASGVSTWGITVPATSSINDALLYLAGSTTDSGGNTVMVSSLKIRAKTSQKVETGSADANVLTLTPPAVAGNYRVAVVASVSSATSGVIAFTLTWKDSNGNTQTAVNVPLFQIGTDAPGHTFTTNAAGNYSGGMSIDIDNSATAIVVKWVGGGTTAAKVSATVEQVI